MQANHVDQLIFVGASPLLPRKPITTRLNRRFGQGESDAHRVRYVKNGLKWARSSVVLNSERPKQKTVHILQSTFHFNGTREFKLR